ncbi:MAG: transglutaminase domain-containing protein [Oscillospiraceae bacterium]|nr:transglutaminase domain-containing protein [Oscillospiraceae bacterium]
MGELKRRARMTLSAVLMLLMLTGLFLPMPTAGAYQTPAFLDAAFHPEAAMTGERVRLDVSCLEQGYVAVSAVSDRRLKFQVTKDDTTYNYDLNSDGTPGVFPVQSGNGSYRFRVMENVVDTKYSELYSFICDVWLQDEFQPFLRPSTYVDYTQDSACVRKAAELAAESDDELELVGRIYEFVCSTVTYDRDKAATVKSGYLPDPDETISTGKGICFDYAALAASMLRSQGIPARMIFGYVAPQGLYHAWNMFYTPQSGWVTVSFEVKGQVWTRMDLTFSANGADADFIGDGSNYSDVYFY